MFQVGNLQENEGLNDCFGHDMQLFKADKMYKADSAEVLHVMETIKQKIQSYNCLTTQCHC
jgi:hypothetical protein